MRKMMTSATALLVAACGAEATPNNAIAADDTAAGAMTAVSAAVAAQPEGWAGSYKAFFDGADGAINIDPPSGSNPTYNVSMEMATNGCSGEALGSGTAKGNALSVIVPVGNSADGWKECRITLTRSATGITVSEASNCGDLHGAGCAFSGMAKKTSAKAGGAAPSAAAMRSIEQEGGAVGCSNSAVSGRAGRVLDRISANDDCDAPPSRQGGSVVGSGNEWLIGSWVDDPPACRGDSAITYSANGDYHASGDFGRWSMQGNKLTHVLLEQLEMGGSDTPVKVRNAKPVAWTIVKPGASKMTVRFPDGTTTALFKCPE